MRPLKQMFAARGRVSPVVSALGVVAGLIILLFGYRLIGIGVAIGAVLAYGNSSMLSRRVDMAADSANLGTALLVMQIGLLITLGVVIVATLLLALISRSLALSAAAGFAVAQTFTLAVFYFQQARNVDSPSAGATAAPHGEVRS